MTAVRAGIAVFQPPLERVAQGPTMLVLAMQTAPGQTSMVRLLIDASSRRIRAILGSSPVPTRGATDDPPHSVS